MTYKDIIDYIKDFPVFIINNDYWVNIKLPDHTEGGVIIGWDYDGIVLYNNPNKPELFKFDFLFRPVENSFLYYDIIGLSKEKFENFIQTKIKEFKELEIKYNLSQIEEDFK